MSLFTDKDHYYAGVLNDLWRQYKQQLDDYPKQAKATLESIVSHCNWVMDNVSDASKDYYTFHCGRAKELLS